MTRTNVWLAAALGAVLVVAAVAVLLSVSSSSGPTRSSGTSSAPAPDPDAPYRLVWNDEFDGSSLDPARWKVENDSTYGDGGGSIACLMDRPGNVGTSDGELRLTARREPAPLTCGGNDTRFPHGRLFSSGHISTKGLAEWTYGRFELRAKLPTTPGTSKGMWPAFWLRPTSGGTGEIDVMEAVGTGPGETGPDSEAGALHQTLWYDYSGTHDKQEQTVRLPKGSPADGMHDYVVDWEPGRISWAVDGREVYRRTERTTPWLASTFDKPFYLRINLAVGGSWPGDPDAGTALPASYDVDYVRVYQRQPLGHG